MIIWINGSFGVGKTTIAERLKTEIKDSIIYDPEEIGVFLSNTLPIKKDDFQDYELWRNFNYEILKFLNAKFATIIVPMTITNPKYYNEIVGKLLNKNIPVKEFILIASKDNLLKRLDKRGNSTEWAYQQIDRCINSFAKYFVGQQINTDDNNIEDVVSKILSSLTK